MGARKMIDVSSNNHQNGEPIDWRAVKEDGYRAVMIKGSQGLDYLNPWRIADGHGAVANGLLAGYYHYASPTVGDAVAQAEYAIAALGCLPNTLGLALDLEAGNGLNWAELATWAHEFLETVASHHITSPLYCDPSWLSNLPGAPFGHKLWLASWHTQEPRRKLWAWQSGAAYVTGIAGQTDVGVYYG